MPTVDCPVTWTVRGPHKLHTFRYTTFEREAYGGPVQVNAVEHWCGGHLLASIPWGHNPEVSQDDFFCRPKKTGAREWTAYLLAAHIIRHDLPCCGGTFMVTHVPFTEYFTLRKGVCSCCGAKWSETDGSIFQQKT